MNVPMLDLVAQYATIKDDVVSAMMQVVETQQFIMGPAVAQLETEIARLSHAKHGVGCASGTDALLLPLKALNLKPGDEVITTPFTFFATAGTIYNAGAQPVFVDIQPDTFNIDPPAVKRAITPRTRAIMPVHLYGQMADMLEIMAIASRNGIKVIEDAAQSIGARRKMDGEWRMAGELGWVTGYSFFPSKNLGAWGDGGMMVTSDDATADRLKKLRLHGGAAYYTRAFNELSQVTPPTVDPANEHIFHQYTIRAERRDGLQAHLKKEGIGHAVYYPIPLHRQHCFAQLGYRDGSLPEAERASREVLSLPIYPELTRAQLDRVIDAVRGFYR
ncbi:MAG: transcriptional regulator [Gemmatimonadetes bacterium 13_2_20CM_2_65_7]|nr:MAG: transcriptional regulator [Gemmatimonadetes bacterium 13_2_20CM_2_65_7]